MLELATTGGIEYYKYPGIEAVQERMVELLRVFLQICTDNDLTYCLDGGTLIGAIRHRDFIPWDDDIDVAMPKKDYLRFQALMRQEGTQYGVSLRYHRLTIQHCCNFLSHIGGDCVVSERGISAIKLDIRPLNFFRPATLSRNETYRRWANMLLFDKRGGTEFGPAGLSKLKRILLRIFFMPYYNLVYGSKRPSGGDSCSFPYYEYATPNIFSYETIFPLKEAFFHGIRTAVPGDFDGYLGKIYGDYMTLPPLRERCPENVGFARGPIPH